MLRVRDQFVDGLAAEDLVLGCAVASSGWLRQAVDVSWRGVPTLVALLRQGGFPECQLAYRFACPRTIFFTFGFFDPRAYSRGFSGFSVLRFLRDARLAFLRSSLLSVLVLAMNPFLDLVLGNFVIW